VSFACIAIDRTGKEIHTVLDVETSDQAAQELQSRGLFITQISPAEAAPVLKRQSAVRSVLSGRPGNVRDRMMLTQQMTMMLQAGSQMVPALTAVQEQVDKEPWRKVLGVVTQKVEDGSSLSQALAEYPNIFDQTFRAIVAAGESTGQTAQAFQRLATMTKAQQEIKVRVIGAMIYPALLLLMAIGVVSVLMFFVLPKFDDLYQTLGTKLPLLTTLMIAASTWIRSHPWVVGFLVAMVVMVPYLAVRMPLVRSLFDRIVLRLPLISTLVQRLVLAKVFRVWGTLIRSNVPLIEGLRLARGSTTNVRFLAILDQVIQEVEEGSSVGGALGRHPIVPRTMVAAISTGEQSGQLGESLLFLADYLDQENTETIGTLTRLVEPLILVIMGAVVGVIAIALFLPLFDLTSAVSGR